MIARISEAGTAKMLMEQQLNPRFKTTPQRPVSDLTEPMFIFSYSQQVKPTHTKSPKYPLLVLFHHINETSQGNLGIQVHRHLRLVVSSLYLLNHLQPRLWETEDRCVRQWLHWCHNTKWGNIIHTHLCGQWGGAQHTLCRYCNVNMWRVKQQH